MSKSHEILVSVNRKYKNKVRAIKSADFVPIPQAAKFCRENGFRLSDNNVQWAIKTSRLKPSDDVLNAGELLSWAQWRDFNSTFKPEKMTVREWLIAIYRGYAFMPVFKGNRRKNAHFSYAWHIALDFDTMDMNSALGTLSQHDLAGMFGAFGYTSPSHKPDKPKGRLCWVFDNPITDREQYAKLYKALMSHFEHADKSAKDAARLFYGSEKCETWCNCCLLYTSDAADE